MRSIFDPLERRRLLRRIAVLSPEAAARWGRMDAHRMVCHLIDAVESSGAPSPEKIGRGPLAAFPLKQLVIYVLPWPKGKLQSPPDLLITKPADWLADVARLRAALDRVGSMGSEGSWPASEVFGQMTGNEWGALLRTHVDHHLRQFGA